MQTTSLKRVFLYNGTRLADLNPALSPAAVKDTYSAMYPELLNAEINGPVITPTELEFTFHRTTGTKGREAVEKPEEKLLSFMRRLDIAVVEVKPAKTASPSAKLTELCELLTPQFGGQALQLPAANCPLLL